MGVVCSEEGGWKPVWLVEVDVEGPCPVGKHCLLRNEAMVAATTALFMGEVHGTLIGTGRLIVVIGHGGMVERPRGAG